MLESAPAHHSRTTGHKIAWDRTTILTTTRYKTQLDLTEHTAIKTRNPLLNRTDSAPTCSRLWDPIIPKIACTIKPRPAGISFPKKKWFYYFSIFYYFRFLLLTSVKESTASPQLTDTTPTNHLHDWHWHQLIIFMTGTDTTQPFIRDVRNFNILLNMSNHVLIYCSWGKGTQKKNSAFNSFGKQWHRPRPFLAIP